MYHYLGSDGVYDSPFEKAKVMMIGKMYKEFDKECSAFKDSFLST
jgi:hypothetical protein